jgi:hypothetical protein
VETRASRPDGSDLAEPSEPEDPTVGFDGVVREEAPHAPPRRVEVQEEARSVVLADEVDDDKTPPRGHRSPFGSSPDLEVHSEEDLLSEPLPRFDDLTPSEPLPKRLDSVRPLPAYDHRNDPTIVLQRRPPSSGAGLIAQLAPQQFYVIVVALIVTGCAAAFIIGAAITSLFKSRPQPVAQPPVSVPVSVLVPVPVPVPVPSVVAAPSVDSVDTPVTLTDLPVDEE